MDYETFCSFDNLYAAYRKARLGNGYVSYAYFAPRPAFNLSSSILVSSTTDGDGCYTIESVPSSGGGLYVKQSGAWVQAL